MPVAYDVIRWQREFLANWPPGSPAHDSYYGRITQGPGYPLAKAARLCAGKTIARRPSAQAPHVARHEK